MTSTPLSPRRELWLLLILSAMQLTNIIDFMIMMPLGPQFMSAFDINAAQFGILISSYSFAAAASGFAAVFYIDKFDRKHLLLSLYAAFALATLACGLAWGFESFLIARVAAGIFGGVLSSLCQTVIGQVIPFDRRGKAMGIFMSAFSISTVAGVPLGLWLATHWDWHMPFIFLASLSSLIFVLAYALLPNIQPLVAPTGASSAHVWDTLLAAITDRGHQIALLFSVLMIGVGFVCIPYITIYMQSNVGLTNAQIPLIYFVGGLATLLSARVIGKAADRLGKQTTYRALAVLVLVPLFALTLLPKVALPLAIVVTTLFFVLMSGRMIPGMAMISGCAKPEMRGTFMSLNGSLQTLMMGIAAWLGGVLITRGSDGLIHGYWLTAVVGAAASLTTLLILPKLRILDGPAPSAAAKP